MVRFVARNRELLENGIFALVLPFVAGAVNASGFFVVGVYTSHVTGNVARIGDELVQAHYRLAFESAAFVAAFFAGAVVATLLVEIAQRRRRARYVSALLAEIATLGLVTVIGLGGREPELPLVTSLLLCFSMGSQNALVTRLSGAVVRTTHLTGVVTDMGIELVRVTSWFQRWTAGTGLRVRVRRLSVLWAHPELARLRLHAGIFFHFLFGAVVGPALYVRHGYASLLLPIGVLAGLVVFDAVFGLRARSGTAVPPAAGVTDSSHTHRHRHAG